MVFAAVPKDVTIEKLTAPEKKALDEYLGKDTRKSILEQIAGNPNTPVLIGAATLVAFLPLLLELLLQAQEDALNITLTDKQKQTLKDTALVSLTGPSGLGFLLGRKVGKGLVETIIDFEFPKDFKFGGGGLA